MKIFVKYNVKLKYTFPYKSLYKRLTKFLKYVLLLMFE